MSEERDARREAMAIIDNLLRQPRIDPRDQLVKDLRAQLEILGLEDELDRFGWRASRSELIEQFEYFKLKLKMGDYPERWERKRQRKSFEHEQFEEQVSDFRSRDRKEIKALETKVQKLELKRKERELTPERSGDWSVWIFLVFALIGVACFAFTGTGQPNFGQAGQVLGAGLENLLELLVTAGVSIAILVILFKTVVAPKKKSE
jgi:hypothetical protein